MPDDIDCDECIAGGESVPTQNRCMEAHGLNIDDQAQRPVGRLPMRSMLLRHAGERR
jgi:hypothetical protein